MDFFFLNDSLFLHMWSCLLACQICTIILVAVDLFNIGNRKVKGFLKLVPTSILWLWSKQPCCFDVHTFSKFSHHVLSSVNSQLLLLMGGSMGSTLTVWLFICMCNSRHCSFGCECLAVTHVMQSAGIWNCDDQYLLLVFWHLLGNQLSAVLFLLGMACTCGEKWGLPSGQKGAGGHGESAAPALPCPSCIDFREWVKHYSLKSGSEAGSLGISLRTQGEELWVGVPFLGRDSCRVSWAAGWDLSFSIPAGCFHKSYFQPRKSIRQPD